MPMLYSVTEYAKMEYRGPPYDSEDDRELAAIGHWANLVKTMRKDHCQAVTADRAMIVALDHHGGVL